MNSPHWVIEFTRTDVTDGGSHKCRYTISKRKAPTKGAALALAGVTPKVHARAGGTAYEYQCIDSDVRASLVVPK